MQNKKIFLYKLAIILSIVYVFIILISFISSLIRTLMFLNFYFVLVGLYSFIPLLFILTANFFIYKFMKEIGTPKEKPHFVFAIVCIFITFILPGLCLIVAETKLIEKMPDVPEQRKSNNIKMDRQDAEVVD